MANPTFVSVINDIRTIKTAFTELATSMDAAKALSRHPGERQIAASMIQVGEAMAKRLQELSLDVSKLAINYSKEDLEAIMEAMSK